MEQPFTSSNAEIAKDPIVNLGLSNYEDAHRFQLELHTAVASGKGTEKIILTEHFPVYTCGRTTPPHERPANSLIPVIDVERGGKLTYHGPGQIVGYPILNLAKRKLSIPQYLRQLEGALIAALQKAGVEAKYKEEYKAGLWVGEQKLVSIGIAVRRWVSFHGFALNVDLDLEPFRKTSPCGLSGEKVTSLQQLGCPVSIERMRAIVKQDLTRAFFDA